LKVLFEINKYKITLRTLQFLRNGKWLNDEIIDIYMYLLKKRNNKLIIRNRNCGKCHFFTTHFFGKIFENNSEVPNYTGVSRWCNKLKIAEHKKLFFPINIGNFFFILFFSHFILVSDY
jgi:sentrin-specific protease 1